MPFYVRINLGNYWFNFHGIFSFCKQRSTTDISLVVYSYIILEYTISNNINKIIWFDHPKFYSLSLHVYITPFILCQKNSRNRLEKSTRNHRRSCEKIWSDLEFSTVNFKGKFRDKSHVPINYRQMFSQSMEFKFIL